MLFTITLQVSFLAIDTHVILSNAHEWFLRTADSETFIISIKTIKQVIIDCFFLNTMFTKARNERITCFFIGGSQVFFVELICSYLKI